MIEYAEKASTARHPPGLSRVLMHDSGADSQSDRQELWMDVWMQPARAMKSTATTTRCRPRCFGGTLAPRYIWSQAVAYKRHLPGAPTGADYSLMQQHGSLLKVHRKGVRKRERRRLLAKRKDRRAGRQPPTRRRRSDQPITCFF
jgi:hypothetical protein